MIWNFASQNRCGLDRSAAMKFSPGSRVEITSGTFARMAGTVVDPHEADAILRSIGMDKPSSNPPASSFGTVWIVIDVFGRLVAVEMEVSQVKLAHGSQG
jgi:transcription antitermination factor NusG